ncbi:MAG: malto-oligosyltrehalose trehalohydrolase, partial [Isosphaeraceae bacterium]|nr:malto-oligosyltrehalose trehalohydrolase [Isosphaeraceae bacterium]
PDPCSRWQPEGINRPSAIWFPEQFSWDEGSWTGIDRRDLVFYELHVGTFTPEGTFDAILPRIPVLRELGITAIELMPVGQFPGSRSWGYDGVFPFAPQQSYGGPEGLHRLVEACHRLGMAVFLDVIYNHFGPDGNVFPTFGDYLTEKYKTDWGPAINYDGPGCDSVRAMVLENVRLWIRDYHCDGLRLDAADQIYDRSPRHILSEIVEVAHREAERLGRRVHVFAETDLNDAPRFLHPLERGGYHLDGHWNDDFHHAAHVVLTGETNGYYIDFAAGPPALAKAFERVFVNDGNFSPFRRRRHGTTATMFPGDRFLAFTQNHDQVGNRLRSDRYAAFLPPSAVRLAAGLLMLAPRLPLLFMGEEYGETNPFPFFCDFEAPELVEAVRKGRKAEFAHFNWEEEPLDPVAASTRDAAVLSWSWDDPTRAGLRALYRDLLQLRRESPTLRDFRHARARILDEPGARDVLEVLRGGLEPDPTPELRIYFNLSGEDRALPIDLAGELPAFRSELAAYGAPEPEADVRFTQLRPHEFLIFGPLRGETDRSAENR